MGDSGRLGWGVLGAAHIARRAVLEAIAASRNGRDDTRTGIYTTDTIIQKI